MKNVLILFLIFFTFSVYGQIITQDNKNQDNKKTAISEKKKSKEKSGKPKSGVEIYFGVNPAYTYRFLKINEGIFAKPLGTKEEEKGAWTTSYFAGVRTPLSQNLKLEIGAGYSSNRETFDFEAKDSVFRYKNTYQSISFPIKLAYTFGKDISFYGGIGIIPNAVLPIKREETLLDINNKENTIKSKNRDKLNTFLVDAVASLGAQIKLSENYGIYTLLEGRQQLINNFNKQAPYKRNAYALGIQVGIEIYL